MRLSSCLENSELSHRWKAHRHSRLTCSPQVFSHEQHPRKMQAQSTQRRHTCFNCSHCVHLTLAISWPVQGRKSQHDSSPSDKDPEALGTHPSPQIILSLRNPLCPLGCPHCRWKELKLKVVTSQKASGSPRCLQVRTRSTCARIQPVSRRRNRRRKKKEEEENNYD